MKGVLVNTRLSSCIYTLYIYKRILICILVVKCLHVKRDGCIVLFISCFMALNMWISNLNLKVLYIYFKYIIYITFLYICLWYISNKLHDFPFHYEKYLYSVLLPCKLFSYYNTTFLYVLNASKLSWSPV